MSEITVDGLRPRCPYCHDTIEAASAQRACERCRAWHHRDCWDEAGERCCACGQASKSPSSARALMRLYSGAVIFAWAGLGLGAIAGAYWGLGIGLGLSVTIGLGVGPSAGYATSLLVDRFAGFPVEERLAPEVRAPGIEEHADLTLQSNLRNLALYWLKLYALIAIGIGLHYAASPVFGDSILLNFAIIAAVLILSSFASKLVKKRRQSREDTREPRAVFDEDPGVKKAAPRSREKA